MRIIQMSYKEHHKHVEQVVWSIVQWLSAGNLSGDVYSLHRIDSSHHEEDKFGTYTEKAQGDLPNYQSLN